MGKYIISGGDGFIGSHTVPYFAENADEVIVLGRKPKPIRLTSTDGVRYIQCDVTDQRELKATIQMDDYDAFIHLAWEASSGSGRTDYRLQQKNALDTVECMKTAKSLGCRRFVCAGSIMEREAMYAIREQGCRPSMPYIYGIGKLMAHCMCKPVAVELGVELVWPIITNAYGAGERSERMLNTTLRKIINGESLEFTSGSQNYDFVYVTDAAKAIYLISKKGRPFCEYVIGSGNARPLKDFLVEMCDTLSPGLKYSFGEIPYTGAYMPLEAFDIKDTTDDCSFIPEVSFGDGVRMTMEWLRQQR